MDITRKMFDLGMILPIFIRREKQMMFKFLSAEERGESLHRLMSLNDNFPVFFYKPLRYLSMKKAYMNRVIVDSRK